jgi:hypothetical protein
LEGKVKRSLIVEQTNCLQSHPSSPTSVGRLEILPD